jgi:hypothetical protein
MIAGFGGGRAAGQPPANIGDVNLNGLPYELADWDLFGQFFLHGSSVFVYDTVAQIDATDVTRDGEPLSMLDYMYFYRVIAGLAQPVEDSLLVTHDSVVVQFDPNAQTVQFLGPDSLACAFLQFQGAVTPYFASDSIGFALAYVYDGVYTRVLIRPVFGGPDPTPLFGTAVAVQYAGSGTLVAAECADYGDIDYRVVISGGASSKLAEVRIGEAWGVSPGALVTVPISLAQTGSGLAFGGFEFTIAYDSTVASLVDVTAGSLLSYCQWEYFVYRADTTPNCDSFSCPQKIVRIVALADINNGGYHPTCFAGTPGELAVLSFRMNEDSSVRCQSSRIRFLWSECTDNSFANTGGDTTFVSRRVFSPWHGDITADGPLPSYSGAPNSCLGARTLRGLDFYDGRIDVLCGDSVDGRGDINRNGLANEMADAVLFSDYFLHGLSAFTINIQEQIKTTDVNADGHDLTVADLEYLWRIIVGDAQPLPRSPGDSGEVAIFVQDTANHTVLLYYSQTLGAVHLIFQGEIITTDSLIGGLTVASASDSGITRVLISPSLLNDYPYVNLDHVGAGLLFHYTGDGQLIYTDATYDGTHIIPSAIQGSDGVCCQHRGNVEGWNDPTGTVDIADLTALVDYLFIPAHRIVPGCRGEADADGDSSVDIADVTSLVDFLFSGVLLPPCH